MMQMIFIYFGGLIMMMMIDYNLIKLFMYLFIYLFMFILLLMGLNNGDKYSFISMNLGVDIYSYVLILLVCLILSLMIMSINKIEVLLINLIVLMLMNMFILFSSLNLFMLYFMFEFSLFPMIMIMIKWGYSEGRYLSSMYMLIYTMIFSLPFIIFLMMLLKGLGSLNLLLLNYFNYYYLGGSLIILLMFMPFLVKMPLYIVHMWLPKAHVDAPLVGSMFLAGVLLKLGGYGLIRLMIMYNLLDYKFIMFILVLSLLGCIILSIQCLVQIDMKILVALSSVVHMGLVIGGLLVGFNVGVKGAMMMMISHGLCSSGMFYLVDFCYKMSGSRSIMINKGFISKCSSMTLMWFLICSCNISIPFSLNLFSEIMLIMSLIKFSFVLMFMIVLIMFFSAIYTLYLYSYSQYGNSMINFMYNDYMINYLIILIHWIFINIIFLCLDSVF